MCILQTTTNNDFEQDDMLCHFIYHNNWYLYDAKSQKMILMMLKEAQVSKEIRIKFIGPLNLVTFVSVNLFFLMFNLKFNPTNVTEC